MEVHVLNLGAGVQSTALYLMAQAGEIHAVDCAIFADTGEEPKAVYAHLEWLQSIGGPKIIVRSAGSLGNDLLHGRNSNGGRFASIPCFTQEQGSNEVGRTPRQCSKEYKTEVIERAIRRDVLGLAPRKHVPKGVQIFQYFGISWDERSRASRIWERFHIESSTRAEPVFPLVDRQWTRANCIEYLAGKVPHETPRSACVFCPFHRDLEWQNLKDRDVEGWARAVEIDGALRVPGNVINRRMEAGMYLHRSCKPLVQVEFHPRENVNELQLGIGFGVECEGVCGV